MTALPVAALWAVAVLVTLFVEVGYHRNWFGAAESPEPLTRSERRIAHTAVWANAACLVPLIRGDSLWTAVTWLLVLLPASYLGALLLVVLSAMPRWRRGGVGNPAD